MYQNLVKPFYQDIKTLLLDTLFPIHCLVCEEEGKKFLCDMCAPKLKKAQQVCIACKKHSIGGLTHPHCPKINMPQGLISVFDYHDDNVSKLIISGKYYFVKNIFSELGEALSNSVKANHPHLTTDNYQLTPIPLHWTRKNWRGFNQAEVLCKGLAHGLKMEIADVLKRPRLTRTQKNLKREERLANMSEAFTLKPAFDVTRKNFIIVDDVTTTGSTLLEAVKTLKQNGANNVWCLTVTKD